MWPLGILKILNNETIKFGFLSAYFLGATDKIIFIEFLYI